MAWLFLRMATVAAMLANNVSSPQMAFMVGSSCHGMALGTLADVIAMIGGFKLGWARLPKHSVEASLRRFRV